MAEILGVGVTHFPPLLGPPENLARTLDMVRASPLVGDMADPRKWPAPMQEELRSKDELAVVHQQRARKGFLAVREAIDAFHPDVVVMFGDDQYENFKEGLVPPIAVYCQDEFESSPFAVALAKGNSWGKDGSFRLTYPGAGQTAIRIVNDLGDLGFPPAWSYEAHLSHAFGNAFLFLDWDLDSPWRYPIIPIAVNAYGRDLTRSKGLFAHLLDERPLGERDPYLDAPNPAGPNPAFCAAFGNALRRVLDGLPGRIAVVASSSWSHGFLAEENHWLWPDIEGDRRRLEELEAGEQRCWADIPNADVYKYGLQEFLSWIIVWAGVLPERKPTIIDYMESWVFNSNKCFAVSPPTDDR